MSLPSGDRHLRDEPSGRLGGPPRDPATVLITGDPAYAATASGQHLLFMVVNLLARQFGVIGRLVIDVPPVPLRDGTIRTHLLRGDLDAALMELVAITAGPEITVERDSDGVRPEATVVVGPAADPSRFLGAAVAVVADGWRAACSSRRVAPAVSSLSPNPAGPYLGACLAASFVFKRLFGRADGIDIALSLWDWRSGPWASLAVGSDSGDLQLPDSYLVGNGAVGAALAQTLAATSGLRGRLIAVDPQAMSSTDRNRLISGGYESVDRAKVDLVRDLCEESGIDVYPVRGRWPDDYVTDPARAIPQDLRPIEDDDRFTWILSCVDRNRDRQGIARYLPRHVLGGSTDGLVAQATYYSMTGPCECLACNHPTVAPEALEQLTPELQQMDPSERTRWLRRHGADVQTIAAIDEYLNAPECGGLGEAELARLGREGEVDWSVGFVSVAAGVMHAALFVQAAQRGVGELFARGSERRLLFWNNELLRSASRRRVACDVCGDPALQSQWHEVWEGTSPPGGRGSTSTP